jgi:hypothetical protein
MGNDFPLTVSELVQLREEMMAANDDQPKWTHLLDVTRDWQREWKNSPAYLRGALKPFIHFVEKYRYGGIRWRHRLYILITGRLPDDL